MLLAIDIGNSNIVIGGIDGDDIRFDSGTATITTPRKSAPVCDGKRTEAVVNVGFYAFQA